jgi:hypothetical protein
LCIGFKISVATNTHPSAYPSPLKRAQPKLSFPLKKASAHVGPDILLPPF